MVKAEQADHTGNTHEYEFESTGYDDIVVKAKKAEHRVFGEPHEKAEEAEHTGGHS